MLNNLSRSSLLLFKGSRGLGCCKETDGQSISLCLGCFKGVSCEIQRIKQQHYSWRLGHPLSLGKQRWETLEKPHSPLSPLLSPPKAAVVHPDLEMTCSGAIRFDCSRSKGSNTTWSCCTEYFILSLQCAFNENSDGQKGILSLTADESQYWCSDTSAAAVEPGQKSRSFGKRFRLIHKMPLFLNCNFTDGHFFRWGGLREGEETSKDLQWSHTQKLLGFDYLIQEKPINI